MLCRVKSEQLFDPGPPSDAGCGAGSLNPKLHQCSLLEVPTDTRFEVAGLFAGVGGIEVGLATHGGRTVLLCENWEPARRVLAERFPTVPLAGDVRDLDRLPDVDVVTAGFPCTDLSQAGRTRGIAGDQSGLVGEVFRLLRARRVPIVVLENVRNMLVLGRGHAMRYIVEAFEGLGYRWAYRLVDSRFTGVPQRRQRVILVAATEIDPATVLFADDTRPPGDACLRDDIFGFYWTEGLRGLGWARDAVPTLKGGSTIGIPSPPAIWHRSGVPGRRLLVPGIEDAEQLQGFPRGWTAAAGGTRRGVGNRWKLVGNAVTVGVAAWLGRRLADPGRPVCATSSHPRRDRWPSAAMGHRGRVWAVEASLWPTREDYRHLDEVVDLGTAAALSGKGAAGFLSRAERSTLRFAAGFLEDVAEHVGLTRGSRIVA
jgi:DNA (cytosine-5)-methyltransferase 1